MNLLNLASTRQTSNGFISISSRRRRRRRAKDQPSRLAHEQTQINQIGRLVGATAPS